MINVEMEKTVEELKKNLETKMVYNNEFLYPWYNPYNDKSKNFSFNWNDVPNGNDNYKFIKFLKNKLNIGRYLFRWEEIPGNDSKKLRKYLKRRYINPWIGKAHIEKTEDGKIISLHFKNNCFSLILNNEKDKVSLKFNDSTMDEFIARTEKYKLLIYNDWIYPDGIKKTDRIIKIDSEKSDISLILNESKTKVSFKIDDIIMDEFMVKLEEGKLNVYIKPKLFPCNSSAVNIATKYFLNEKFGELRRVRELGEEWRKIPIKKEP